jgi:hypothetical protein
MGTRSDPVLPDQGGRMMPLAPAPPVMSSHEELVRRKAHELYEQAGREQGHALDHWLAAERQITAVQGETCIHRGDLDVVFPHDA